MGGTSTDVCLITDEGADRTSERSVGGLPIRLPMIDIHTVGAGGGSIVWRDVGGALRVGPESAGANPGPACYGRGGTRPTVTDANLVLGRLPATLAGGLELDRPAAEAALGDLDPADVIEIVNAEMLRALRVVSVERGHDPAEFALVAYGGAGPLHACALAEELGIETVLVPGAAGVLSALGLVASDERRDAVTAYVCPLEEAGELPAKARPTSAIAASRSSSRFRSVPISPSASTVPTRSATESPTAIGRSSWWRFGRRTCVEGPQLAWPAGEALRVEGPEALELDGATCWIPPGWVGARDGTTIRLTRL